jgi:hypothetical protein
VISQKSEHKLPIGTPCSKSDIRITDNTRYSPFPSLSISSTVTFLTQPIPQRFTQIKIQTRLFSSNILFNGCTLFESNTTLLASPFSLNTFRDFTRALEEKPIQITSENVLGLTQLCTEFSFFAHSSKLSSFHRDTFLKIMMSSLDELSNGID